MDDLHLLFRYLLDGLEPKFVYPNKECRLVNVADYKEGLLKATTKKSSRVAINGNEVVIDWEQLEEKSLEAA